MRKYTWYDEELIEALNKLGFVHFVAKEPLTNLEEGRAFFLMKKI